MGQVGVIQLKNLRALNVPMRNQIKTMIPTRKSDPASSEMDVARLLMTLPQTQTQPPVRGQTQMSTQNRMTESQNRGTAIRLAFPHQTQRPTQNRIAESQNRGTAIRLVFPHQTQTSSQNRMAESQNRSPLIPPHFPHLRLVVSLILNMSHLPQYQIWIPTI
jgi:hypothetical protein